MTRTLRCPDCTLAHRRAEDQRRLDRIRTATPPATTLDGQLQRMRERKRAIEAGEPVPDADELDEPEPPDDLGGDALDDADEPAVDLPPVAVKPGHRQPARPPDRATGERPWWATTKPGELTKAAAARSQEMTADARRRGLKVNDQMN